MEENEDSKNIEINRFDNTSNVKIKLKKRSLVERELETNLTTRVTSPITNLETTNTSRYGRARRSKTENEVSDKSITKALLSPRYDKSPNKSLTYKMNASISPIKKDSKRDCHINNQIENIYNHNISLSRFGSDEKSPKMSPKIYTRKDLIQTKDTDESDVLLIKNMFSPVKSTHKSNKLIFTKSVERHSYNSRKSNGHIDVSSVVKTLDFDGNKKKKKDVDKKTTVTKSELFEIEAQCEYQVGDLAWAQMKTYPFWPCIVTREPFNSLFVKKKMMGKLCKDIIHVTFFGDNGRRSWILESKLRKFQGLHEFELARDNCPAETKKKDPKLYAAFFVSQRKLPRWYTSVEEAEILFREPKRLRIDSLNEMLNQSNGVKLIPTQSKKITRTGSDVSLSESLYDSLFSEDDGKTSDSEKSKIKNRKTSFDVSDVVTACLDNMAAKTGMTKIQKQSHMDRWLQKAKSSTPEKSQINSRKLRKNKNTIEHIGSENQREYNNESPCNVERNVQNHNSEHDYSQNFYKINGHNIEVDEVDIVDSGSNLSHASSEIGCGIGIISKVETLAGKLETYNDLTETNSMDTDILNDNENNVQEEIIIQDDMIVESCESINVFSNIDCIENPITVTNSSHETDKVSVADKCIDPDDINNQSNLNESHLPTVLFNNHYVENDKDKDTISDPIDEINFTCSLPRTENNVDNQNEKSNISNKYTENYDERDCIINNDNETSNSNFTTRSCDSQEEFNEESLLPFKNDNVNKVVVIAIEPNETTLISSDTGISKVGPDINLKTISPEKKNTEICDPKVMGAMKTSAIPKSKCCFEEIVKSSETKTCTDSNLTECSEIDTHYLSNSKFDEPKLDSLFPKLRHNEAEEIKSTDINLNPKKSNCVIVLNNDFDTIVHMPPKLNINKNLEAMTESLDKNINKNSQNATSTTDAELVLIDPFSDLLDTDSVGNDSEIEVTSKIEIFQNSSENYNIEHIEKECSINQDCFSNCNSNNNESNQVDIDVITTKDCDVTTVTKNKPSINSDLKNPKFLKYLEQKQDYVIDDHPELSYEEITSYLYNTWLYEENLKTDQKKSDEIEQDTLIKGHNVDVSTSKRAQKRKKKLKLHKIKQTLINFKVQDNINKVKDRDTFNRKEIENDAVTSAAATFNSDNIATTENMNKSNLKTALYTEEVAAEIQHGDLTGMTSKEIEPSDVLQGNNKPNNINNDKSEGETTRPCSSQSNSSSNFEFSFKVNTLQTLDTMSMKSTESDISNNSKRKACVQDVSIVDHKTCFKEPEFIKYLEIRQDVLIDEHPELSQEEITDYLYKTWLYEESKKSDQKKTDDLEQANIVKGLNQDYVPVKKVRKRIPKIDKDMEYSVGFKEVTLKEKSKRRIEKQFYKEDYSDFEDDMEFFDIFKQKSKPEEKYLEAELNPQQVSEIAQDNYENEPFNQVEEYFKQLLLPKPNLFKGLIREKVCDICERVGNLLKCKGCHGMFHIDCVNKTADVITTSSGPIRGRKKKRKRGRKAKGIDDSKEDHSDKSQDLSEDVSVEFEKEPHIIADADDFESKLETKMKDLLERSIKYDVSSDEELSWSDTEVGKCVIVDIQPRRINVDTNFKCKDCEKHSVPVCFVCKSDSSPKNKILHRQKCQVAHCYKHYHLECLEHWPQAHFNSSEPMKNKKNEYADSVFCPRHVCHTCVCDDPRGCKTRFSGDKLARCVKCPATYHTFTKCLPAGTQILTGSQIICPRHYEHRAGKAPCHVNTGWCFICALGGTLICCEYCPTSFHAECLNIKPPDGGYMCEDCETGCLPLYGRMVWVKLGHYRWWPGIILHPSEIPENIMAVKHNPGEFVVRFFGQYDHYWVNRGRVFPFQEGDTGKISSQKSKIDAAFTLAVEHAQRACEVLKDGLPPNEGDEDIASSLLPPHYVKLKVNKPVGSLRRPAIEESSLTQCECDPNDVDPCGPYTHCLNRMLLTECGPSCRAGDRCRNRAFEKRQYPSLQPYRARHRGWGLHTRQDIKAGQFVIEYVGELIDEEEFQRRMRWKHEIRDENYYFLTLDKERMIDAGPKGNLARFMNHSCEPNCETQKWTVLGDVRVGLFALLDIPANSELTFNYNLECAGIDKKKCMCGTKRCSGFMGAKPKDEPKKTKLVKRPYKKRKPIEESPSTSKPKPRPRNKPKNRDLTEIEKDLLIIKSATNGLSSDSECSGRLNSVDSVSNVKRKHVDECNDQNLQDIKRTKLDHIPYEVE